MKLIERLEQDFEKGLFKNGMNDMSRFSASGIRHTYEVIGDDRKRYYYVSFIQNSRGYKIIEEFIRSKNIKVTEI